MKIVTSLSFRGQGREAFEFYAKRLGGKPRKGFDVSLHSGDVDQARRWFDALKEGGTVVMDVAETFWSLGYGSVVDRFGVPLMVNTTST